MNGLAAYLGGGFGGGGGCGGGYDVAPVQWQAPAGCPAPAALDQCNPAIQALLAQAAAQQMRGFALAAKGKLTRDAMGNTAMPVGIGNTAGTTVAANGSATFSVTPPNGESYCFIDFDVSRVSSPFFLITSLVAGRYAFISDPVGIPADTLSPDAIHPFLDMGQTACNGTLSITVVNIDAAARPFNGTLWALSGGQRNYGPCLPFGG